MRHEEEDIQRGCVRWFNAAHANLSGLLFHPANGGARTATEGAIFKGLGVVAGVSDLILDVPSHGWHGLRVELKSKTGKVSPAQEEWMRKETEYGYRCVVVRSLTEFIKEVEGYLGGNDD